MEIKLLTYLSTAYLVLVLGVVLAAIHRRINLFKTFIISLLFTPISGIIVLCSVPKKIVVTYYNPLNPCAICPYGSEPEPEVCENCELIQKSSEKLSIKKRYWI